MIWIPVALSLLSPLLSVGIMWYLFQRKYEELLGVVVGTVDEGIRKQDDRIRKARDKEQPRNDTGTPPDPFATTPQRGRFIPGQPIEGG